MPESLGTDSVAHANPAANQASFRCQFGGQIKDARIIRNQIRYLDANPAAGLKCQNHQKPTQWLTPIRLLIQASFRRQSGSQIKDARIIRNQLNGQRQTGRQSRCHSDVNPAATLNCQNYWKPIVVDLGVVRRQSAAIRRQIERRIRCHSEANSVQCQKLKS